MVPAARDIDCVLRRTLKDLACEGPLNGAERLAMFPTPPSDYFRNCIADARCPAHLRAIGLEIFGAADSGSCQDIRTKVSGGGIFTRFMIAGFAAYRAMEVLKADAYESYPDLLFRLADRDSPLAPKRNRRAALATRRRIVARMAARTGITAAASPATLDEADAAILALSVASAIDDGALIAIDNPAEGRFILPLDASLHRLGRFDSGN